MITAEMISFQHGPLGIKKTEVWGDPFIHILPWGAVRADIIRYWYPNAPVGTSRSGQTQYTIEIDLTLGLDSIFGAMDRGTRRQIRHATAEGFCVHLWNRPDEQTFGSFHMFHDKFTSNKILSCGSIARLRALNQKGMLSLSSVASASDESLVWHCYETVGRRARCLHSVSIHPTCPNSCERNKVGRANRYLHFADIAAFHSAGLEVYDLGGWYDGKENAKLLGVNRFKEGFGGTIVKRCLSDVGVTPLGKCWLALHKLRERVAG